MLKGGGNALLSLSEDRQRDEAGGGDEKGEEVGGGGVGDCVCGGGSFGDTLWGSKIDR